MPLYVIATPIGDDKDISLRALDLIREAQVLIGEEEKVLRRRLKMWGIEQPEYIELYNEHSKPEDIKDLAKLCTEQNVCLVSDAGTPGFCDPSAELVNLCRQQKIPVFSVPGPSSLTAFLSVCGRRVNQFHFAGFLPADKEERARSWGSFKSLKVPLIIMDTPYRLTRLLEELAQQFPTRNVILGLELSQPTETVVSGKASQLKIQFEGQKREFILMVE